MDLIDRQAAIDAFCKECYDTDGEICDRDNVCGNVMILKNMPSAQPEIIRCKDCRWWEKISESNCTGYCHAAKHGHFSKHWEISIIRTYRGDFYCADAERRTDAAD